MSDQYTDEELSVDFTGVEGAAGFKPLPNGSYLLQVTDWELTETKNPGKLPVGTPGLKWEFTVIDGDHEDRKLWTNHWLTATSFPYLKGFLAATGEYSEEELDGPLGKATDIGDRIVNAEAKITAKVGIQRKNPEYNEIKRFEPASEYKGPSASGNTSMMP